MSSFHLSYKIADTNLFGDRSPPTAKFEEMVSGFSVAFDASQSTDDIGVVSCEWSFGEGTYGSGKTFTHVYAAAGTYNVTLTVKDANGNSDMYSKTINIAAQSGEGIPLWILATAGIVIVGITVAGIFVWRRANTSKSKKA